MLCNPGSGRVLRQLEKVRRIGRELGGELYREAGVPTEIKKALRELSDAEIDTLCIVGGDGTVHAALTALHALRPGGPWPVIAAVPGGTTNMTVQDLGVGGSLLGSLVAIRAWRDGEGEKARGLDRAYVRRPMLCVEHAANEPLCGMFFGAGAIADGVRFFEQRAKRLRLGAPHKTALSVARVLFSLAFGKAGGESLGCRVASAVDGRPATEHRSLFFLVSTLRRLILGTRPHWGEENAPLHFTLVDKDARAFWRSLPRLARGRPGTRLTPERGYLSHNAGAVELTFDGPFVVDGQIYRARAADGPCRITAPRRVDWLVP